MIILSLDLSTKCTGYSVFKDGVLEDYGAIYPAKYPGYTRDNSIKRGILFSKSISNRIFELVVNTNPDKIIIEDVSQNGLPGIRSLRTLISMHGIVLSCLELSLDKIQYLAPSSWRKALNIRLSESDKQFNKGCIKKDKIGWKHLSKRYVLENYGLNLGDDECDAISIGCAAIELNL